jgi:excisionase family DNA binding protein
MKEANWITPSQAAEVLQCTSRKITKWIVDGKLSASREDGKWYIEKSEFYRVFPDAYRKEQERNPNHKALEQERIKTELEMFKQLAHSKDKEIEFLRHQLETFNKKESQFLDALQSQTKLLEHQSRPKKWTDIFKKRDK